MPLPGGVTTITVTGKYTDITGTALAGSVLFTPSWELLDPTGSAVLGAGTVIAGLDSTGAFSIILPTTDNAELNPPGWNYLVQVAVPGAVQNFSTYIGSSFGASVDISVLTPAPTPALPAGPATVNGGITIAGGGLALQNVTVHPTATAGQGTLYVMNGILYYIGPSGTITPVAAA